MLKGSLKRKEVPKFSPFLDLAASATWLAKPGKGEAFCEA